MKKRTIAFMTVAFIIMTSFTGLAHPGRTDSSGGHYVRTAGWGYPVGSYHYHNAPRVSYTANFIDKSTVVLIQEKLNELGYDCGVADGIMGTKTKTAIKNFQRDNGLVVDGIVGTKTKTALGI
ncbi:peptidoglycan-binding protein [Anaerosolibacter sp.]|uniref:peptidoglycan-binding protein n=1 Tax=Anaerosolibacter sp. TaxID=1872527 RepID=UPI0039EFD243